MYIRIKRVAPVVVVLSLLSTIGGCAKKEPKILSDAGAYSSGVFEVPTKDGYEMLIGSIIKDAEDVCVSVKYVAYDTDGRMTDQVADIYTLDNNGKLKNTLEIAGNQVPSVALENEYALIGYKPEEVEANNGNFNGLTREVLFLDKEKGSLTRTIEPDFQPSNIVAISDGFVISGSQTIARYSKDGVLLSEFKPGFSIYTERTGFFEDKGKYYVIEEKEMGILNYHEVNFESHECPTIASSQNMGVVGATLESKYFFNPDGEYRINLSRMQVDCIAEWNCIDIRPPKKNLDTPAQLYSLDDNRFAKSYEYQDGTAEVLVFQYDPTVDRSNVETIKIGGYGVYDDPILQWAVYSFNTSNTDFRVILEDYGGRFEGYTPEEQKKAKLELTQYFNQGNTPDIFYGTRFDYSYMGRNGMVVDLSEYMTGNEASQLTEVARQLVFDESGKCYQLFSGYIMYGYAMQKSDLEKIPDTSFQTLFDYSANQGIPCSFSTASDVVDVAIRYNFADLWGAYDGNRKITHEDLANLLKNALSMPVGNYSYASAEDVKEGRVLMCNATIWCVIDDSELKDGFEFVGYPSNHGSVHLAVPQSCLAVSTTAKNKDKCWEMLTMLFSEEAQKQTIISGYIPIDQSAVDKFCEAAMHPEAITDEVLQCYIGNDKPATQEQVDSFKTTIAMADTIQTYDWGIFSIINDEVNSYYSQNRSPEKIADTLEERLTLYMQENYQ